MALDFSFFYGHTRYAVLLLSLLCLTFSFSNHLVFSFTVICMGNEFEANQTHWLESPTQLNSLFSAVAIGCLLGTLPISFFIHHMGIRVTCTVYGLISSLATLLFPLFVNLGYPVIFFLRVLQGIPVALSYPTLGQISSQWSTDKGLGSFVSILSCHMQLCSIITMPVSSLFCDSPIGWKGSFYFHGLFSLILFLFFFYFYRDQPNKHRSISSNELKKISSGKSPTNLDRTVPYKEILADPAVWSIWSALLGSTTGIQLFIIYGPIYVNRVLGFDIRSTGWGTAFPFLLAGIVKLFLGPISDKSSYISPRVRLILFTVISQYGMAICLVIMSFTSSVSVAVGSYTAAICFSGVICVGAIRGASMVYRHLVHFVMALASLLLVFIVLLLPAVITFICPNNSPDEWSQLLIYTAIFVTFCSTPYIFFAQDKPAKYINVELLNDTNPRIEKNGELPQ